MRSQCWTRDAISPLFHAWLNCTLARLHAIHVYTYIHGDVCRSNRNGIPRINNALYVVVLLDTRTIAVVVIVNAHEINNHVFVTMHATWARVYSRSSLKRACARARAHAYARTHARTHARTQACSRGSRSNWNGIQANNANTCADKTVNNTVDGFRAFRYYFKCNESRFVSLSLSLSRVLISDENLHFMDNISEVSRHVLCRQIRCFSLFWELY